MKEKEYESDEELVKKRLRALGEPCPDFNKIQKPTNKQLIYELLKKILKS